MGAPSQKSGMSPELKLVRLACFASVPSLILGGMGFLGVMSAFAKPHELDVLIAEYNQGIAMAPEDRPGRFSGVLNQAAWRLNGAEIVSSRVTRVLTIIPPFSPQTYADLKAKDGRVFHCWLGTYGSSWFHNIRVESVEGLPDPAILAKVERKAMGWILQTVKEAQHASDLCFGWEMDKALDRPSFRSALQKELAPFGVKLVPRQHKDGADPIHINVRWKQIKSDLTVEGMQDYQYDGWEAISDAASPPAS